jgi:hypothetical protein
MAGMIYIISLLILYPGHPVYRKFSRSWGKASILQEFTGFPLSRELQVLTPNRTQFYVKKTWQGTNKVAQWLCE